MEHTQLVSWLPPWGADERAPSPMLDNAIPVSTEEMEAERLHGLELREKEQQLEEASSGGFKFQKKVPKAGRYPDGFSQYRMDVQGRCSAVAIPRREEWQDLQLLAALCEQCPSSEPSSESSCEETQLLQIEAAGQARWGLGQGRGQKRRRQGSVVQGGGAAIAKKAISAAHRRELVGQTFWKEWPGHGWFQGTIMAFRPKRKLYQIEYTDGDQEELWPWEVESQLCSPGPGPPHSYWAARCCKQRREAIDADADMQAACWSDASTSSSCGGCPSDAV